MVHAFHDVRDNILYFERMCTHESLPPDQKGGGRTRRVMNQICVGCAICDACMRHIKMLFFWYSNIYACITHVHTYVWGTCMKWLSLETLPHLVIIDGLYISWARLDVHPSLRPTIGEVTRVDSSSLSSRYRIVVRQSW